METYTISATVVATSGFRAATVVGSALSAERINSARVSLHSVVVVTSPLSSRGRFRRSSGNNYNIVVLTPSLPWPGGGLDIEV
ncbi:hypothetical protein J6590_012550 [Homalodisca vitripennis]|nr:hypothetical protein J6590_012550 [Homalodisca vitripennis]